VAVLSENVTKEQGLLHQQLIHLQANTIFKHKMDEWRKKTEQLMLTLDEMMNHKSKFEELFSQYTKQKFQKLDNVEIVFNEEKRDAKPPLQTGTTEPWLLFVEIALAVGLVIYGGIKYGFHRFKF